MEYVPLEPKDIVPVMAIGGAILAFLCFLSLRFVYTWLRGRTQYLVGNDLRSARHIKVYTAQTVEHRRIYVLWHSEMGTSQDFVVLDPPLEGWFRIGVYAPGGHLACRGKRRFVATGWVTRLSPYHHISQGDLAPTPIGSAHHDAYLKRVGLDVGINWQDHSLVSSNR